MELIERVYMSWLTPISQMTSDDIARMREDFEQHSGKALFDRGDDVASNAIDSIRTDTPGLSQAASMLRAALGFGKDLAIGAGHLMYMGSLSGKIDSFLRDAQTAAELAEGKTTPQQLAAERWEAIKAAPSALVKPITDGWDRGDYFEASTRAVLEVGSVVLPFTKLAKAGKLAEGAGITRGQAVRVKIVPAEVKGIGPAYETFEEIEALMQVGKLRPEAHVLGVVVKNLEGRAIGEWYEVSERGVATARARLLGHSEQKALARLTNAHLERGSTVELVGHFPPCNLSQGCSTAMTAFARQFGVDIRYRHVWGETGTTIHDFRASEGRITQKMIETWRYWQ